MPRLRVGVVGASGYTGAELVRLLLGHSEAELAFMGGHGSAGRALAEVHPHLDGSPVDGLPIRPLEDAASAALDVAFLALPHGESSRLAPDLLEASTRVIDLAGDFRLRTEAYPAWYGFEHPQPAWLDKAVYGLPERFRERIRGADLVANPGCFPTPVVLGLAPLLERGLVAGPVVVDGKTGVSGAGRSGGEATSHGATEESVRPYRFPVHQHTPEIEHALALATGHDDVRVTFVPHLVPAVRGVLTTSYARATPGATTEALVAALEGAYRSEPFVRVLPAGAMADTKRVRGSNVVELQAAVDARSSTAVVVGALDNLVKGAAGQAIQNLNAMLGIDETLALPTVGMYP